MTKYFLLAIILSTILFLPAHLSFASYKSIDFNYENQQAGVLESLSSFFSSIFSGITQQSHAQTPDITTGLVGHWTFDEGSDFTAGDSAGTNDGTLTNMDPATDWVTGQIDGALDFDGSGDYVQINNATSLVSPYSFSMWFYPTTLSGSQSPIAFILGGNPYMIFSGGRLQMTSASAGTFRTFCDKIFVAGDLNKWWHLTFIVNSTTDASQWKCYLDSADIGVTDSTSSGTYTEPASTWTIGAYYNNSYWFDGLIDDVRIYNRALTQADITELHLYTGGTPTYECNDTIDNDSDGLIDYPQDPGCTSSTDDDETDPPVDTIPPILSNGQPTGTLPSGTTQTTMSVTTDENSTCKYSITAGTSYTLMTNTFSTTGTQSHSTTITGLIDGSSYSYYIRCQDTTGNPNTSDYPISFSIDNPPVPDTQSPTIPTNLTATPVSSSQINLTWSASTDNVGVTGYNIYRNSTLISTSANTSYSNTGLSANTTYTYTVSAYDAVPNTSGQSTQDQATTQQITAGTINAASCSQVDVQAAVNLAVGGDTVLVPAGSCTWTTTNGTVCWGGYTVGVCLEKGITLQGGIGGTTAITFGSGFTRGGIQISPDATTLSENQAFEVLGFTFDGVGQSMGNEGLFSIRSSNTSIMSNITIHDNTFKDVTSKAIVVNGAVNGVIYENTFTDVGYSVTSFGGDVNGWNTFGKSFGQADNLFVEDNIINFTKDMSDVGGTDHGQGAPGFVFRYNTFDLSNTTGGWVFVIHGLQSMSVSSGYTCPSGCGYPSCSPSPVGSCNETVNICQQWSTIKSEYYGNIINNATSLHSIMTHRGSWLMMFDNQIIGAGSTPPLHYAQYACDSCQDPSSPAYSQHVQNSYIFSNLYNGVDVSMTKGLDFCADASIGIPYTITEEVDYWNYNASFNGTFGIGVGLFSAMSSTCTTGVGYFATDKGGDWNTINGTANDGGLYKCTATNNWQLYYTPYTYPHPLTQAGQPPTLLADLNQDGIVNSLDWGIMNTAWGTADPIADINNDGIVNTLDWSIMNSEWGRSI